MFKHHQIMQKGLKYLLVFIIHMLWNIKLNAQDMGVEMADQFRADGKIYVVVAVIAIVFLGISLYLVYLDRKISKIEKSLNKK